MDSKSVIDLQISLDANEVWYQILHSLWNKSGIWVIQFPLSISPDGQSFTILRTLYTLVISASASTLSYRTSLLPVEVHKAMRTVWFETSGKIGSCPLQRYHQPRNMDTILERREFHGLYTYWVFFSPDASHICLIDQKCFAPNSIAIFSRNSGHDQSPRLVLQDTQWLRDFDPTDTHCSRAFWDDKKAFSLCFHTHHPLIAINTSTRVFLCKFEEGKSRSVLKEFLKVLLTYWEGENTFGEVRPEVLNFGTPKTPLWQGSPMFAIGGIWNPVKREISFSTCGQYIVSIDGSSSSAVFPLPPWALSSKTPLLKSGATSRESRHPAQALRSRLQASEAPETTLSNIDRQYTLSCQQRILTSNESAFDSNGQRFGLQLSCADNAITLHQDQAKSSGKAPQSLLLTHLPKWVEENSDVSVKISSNSESSVQIVLNKVTEPWSGITEPADQHLPAIVTRDKESIRERSIASGQYCDQTQKLEGVPRGFDKVSRIWHYDASNSLD